MGNFDIMATNGSNGENIKIKVTSADIVVHGTADKPYYEIKYREISSGEYHIGYSSYNLDNVFGWLDECFEIIDCDERCKKDVTSCELWDTEHCILHR